jgi:hypothetical protein
VNNAAISGIVADEEGLKALNIDAETWVLRLFFSFWQLIYQCCLLWVQNASAVFWSQNLNIWFNYFVFFCTDIESVELQFVFFIMAINSLLLVPQPVINVCVSDIWQGG